MTEFWVFCLIFCSMCIILPGRHWVSAQSLTESSVYQPDEELSVDIRDPATLYCCVSEELNNIISWFKQLRGKEPQIIVRVFKNGGEIFYNNFQKSRFKIERHDNCVNMTILTTVQSDEATYYCATRSPYTVFGDGTYLNIEETSKPALYNNSVVCESMPHGNSTNVNTQEKTVLILGTALGLCALVIFSLTYFILRKRKNYKTNAAIRDSPRTRRENGTETMNYAALQFSKRKSKDERIKSSSLEECVYSDVQYNITHNL
ncbi:uncharacterized protein Hap1MRO34_012371 isoform 2-T2 [Clarias gariepinus]|uniref:uncharacterized protein LOC128531702 isoform X2 n=1 Tax=Clarias gariepinus TaxID=13013 RepID=UPI00234C78BE|nr:uncharacterized protein LOC128531702 isoform X2 [Clarias gariepinus]